MKELIIKYLRYNVWANQTLADYLSQLSDEQLEREIVSSFPSIRKTVLHIWDAEILWQLRLEGISLPEFPSKNFKNDNATMLKGLVDCSKAFLANMEAQDDSYFTASHTYMTISYGETTQKAYDMIHHCMNHSTFHRGQVIMMLRQLGLSDPPHLDEMLFLISNN